TQCSLCLPLFPYTKLFRSRHRPQDAVIRVETFRGFGARPFRLRLENLRLDLGDDLGSDAILEREKIVVGAVVFVGPDRSAARGRSEEHTSELQSLTNLVCP